MQIIYNVFNSDGFIFHSCDKEKVNKFIETYNRFNSDKLDVCSDKAEYLAVKENNLNFLQIEEEADKIIKNYDYFCLVTVQCDKDIFTFKKHEVKYLDKNNLWKEFLIEYNETGFYITFPINKDISYLNIGEIIFDNSLISLIKAKEQELRNSIKGNILYVVFENDCGSQIRLFETFSKEKAKNFVRDYNDKSNGNKVEYNFRYLKTKL